VRVGIVFKSLSVWYRFVGPLGRNYFGVDLVLPFCILCSLRCPAFVLVISVVKLLYFCEEFINLKEYSFIQISTVIFLYGRAE